MTGLRRFARTRSPSTKWDVTHSVAILLDRSKFTGRHHEDMGEDELHVALRSLQPVQASVCTEQRDRLLHGLPARPEAWAAMHRRARPTRLHTESAFSLFRTI